MSTLVLVGLSYVDPTKDSQDGSWYDRENPEGTNGYYGRGDSDERTSEHIRWIVDPGIDPG